MKNRGSGESWRPSTLVLVCAGALLLLYFAGLGRLPLLEPDEGRYTEIPREMLATGDFVLPHLNGVLYFEKPPLLYWLVALAIKLFGLNEFASRFWSAIFGLGGLWLVYLFARRTSGRRDGFLSALILGTSPLYLVLAHLTTTDMALTFFMTGTLVFFYVGHEDPLGEASALFRHGAFACAALAVLTKGLVGAVLPVGIAALYILVLRRWELLRRVPWVTGSLLFLAIAAPWHIAAALKDPDFLWFYVVREHFLRYLTTLHARTEPLWFFFPVLVWGLLPWVALIPAALAGFLRGLRHSLSERAPDPKLFLWIWAVVIVLFFSASKSKLIPYVLPALPALAILIASAIAKALDKPAWMRRTVRICSASLFFGSATLGGIFIQAGLGGFPDLAVEKTLPWVVTAGSLLVATSLVAMILILVEPGRRWVLATSLCACAVFACVWTGAPQVQGGKSMLRISACLKRNFHAGDSLFCFRYYPQTLPVYSGLLPGLVDFQGEQAFGISKLPEAEREAKLKTPTQFRELWLSGLRVYCVTDRDSMSDLDKDEILPRYTIVQEKQVLLLTNRPPEGEGDGGVVQN